MNLTSRDAAKLKPRGQAASVNYGGAREQNKPATAAPAIVANNLDDGMNKTERAYHRLLELQQRAGEIRDFKTHAITFKLGKDCRYTPEFLVIENDGTITVIEVKGFMRDDALVKFRAAQAMFPWFRFKMVSRVKGEWLTIRD